MRKLPVLLTALFVSFQFAFAQQSPEEFLGYPLGTSFTRHHKVVEYFEHVAENSPLVKFQKYGETYEGRPLTYAVISTEENLQNLEEIRKNHLQNAGISTDSNASPAEKGIVWLSYNVHGNETSSTEAAMKTLYELITQKQEWLKDLVVIMDPAVNPDGRDRYVNWYKQVKSTPNNSEPMAVEHNEPWPGGRPNHYLFDLNRDWAWATQAETRQRLDIYNDWLPHIHVDFHEQGRNDPYYFAPAAEPLHEVITPFQREFQTEIGKNHAKYFDEQGWLYFTKERFDLLYPSYGDTYPTYLGAIGMTYEQAGHTGLAIQTDHGYELNLVDRIEHHHTTGLSTVEIAAQNVDRLNSEFAKFYNNPEKGAVNYVLTGHEDKLDLLKELLDRHEISYAMPQPGNIKGYDPLKKKNSRIKADENTLVVSTAQPKGKMVKVLFEPSAKLSDSLTYDITAWSLPYAYGLEAISTGSSVPTLTSKDEAEIINQASKTATAYITEWNSMKDARFLTALLKEGIRVRFTETALENSGKNFAPGSLIINRIDNNKVENLDELLVDLANKYERELTAAATGFSTSGPDLGSSQVKAINKPRIGLLRGEGTSSLNQGELWYFFEQDLNYPVTSIDTRYFGDIDLSKLDVIILPSGNYSDLFDEKGLDRLTSWVRGGGKVIAIGRAIKTFAGEEDFNLKFSDKEEADTISKPNLVPYAQREREEIKDLITGSIIETKMDKTHPMAFGYEDNYLSLKLSNDSYSLLSEGYNVGYLEDSPNIVAGFVGNNAKEKIKNSLTFGVEPMGEGSFIYLVDNPLFRAFWQNGKLLLVNSIFFVDNSEIKNYATK
ncbi:M14 family metallopeptidase [Salinimicrobium sp. TH3]|uniref:M14 family metallopeptidase n=1 Tax=Salinimicrobium sp. TH3 TaxID=2997342 RepID=UPI00227647E0|nr:M14 family metallopeptidase [Salinimicrobium sp. TH3]MCY2687412.1 M14 family metallopeptidase [Salinimicrobium sp. TH3]